MLKKDEVRTYMSSSFLINHEQNIALILFFRKITFQSAQSKELTQPK
ncbi:hypothetical protein EMA8858_03210 [Emticicia aquatica]|jgi:hypothetical protein|uniref:Uncharacterized protein n=1 Tax=Emticicia aquatica TaxID=1681835 RepID=A0ABN8EYV9_9BACT|nr:hypothetical protein EMA8858_03210 [Emticicia aquatica]